MKFGKYLAGTKIPEWSKYYINYKYLKRSIKQLGGGGTKKEAQRVRFFFLLDRELEKIDSFYHYKVKELERRWKVLYSKYEQECHPYNSLQEEVDLKANMGCIVKEAKESLEGLRKTKEELALLKSFSELNRTGFEKILKKFDKKLNHESKQVYLNKVKKQGFCTCALLPGLTKHLEALLLAMERWLSSWDENIPGAVPLRLYDQVCHEKGVRTFSELKRIIEMDQISDVEADLALFLNEENSSYKLLYSLLKVALLNGSINSIIVLAQRCVGFKPMIVDMHGQNILHQLVALCFHTTDQKAIPKKIQAIETLLKALPSACNPHFVDEKRRLPIHYAADSGNFKLFELLLNDMKSRAPTVSAYLESLRTLDSHGYSLFACAVYHGHNEMIEKLILQLGRAIVNEKIFGLSMPPPSLIPTQLLTLTGNELVTLSITEHSHYHHFVDVVSQTPLMLATRNGLADTVGLLLINGANVNIQDEHGETALYVGTRLEYLDVVKRMLQQERSNSIATGEDFWQVDNYSSSPVIDLDIPEYYNGWTPLLVAATCGNLEMVTFLLDNGADPNVLDFAGWTAHEHAVFRGHIETAKKLSEVLPMKFTHPLKIEVSSKFKDFINKPSPPLGNSPSSFTSSKSLNKTDPNTFEVFGHNYLSSEIAIMINLGSVEEPSAQPIKYELSTLQRLFPDNEELFNSHTRYSICVTAYTGDDLTSSPFPEAVVDLPSSTVALEPMFFRCDSSQKQLSVLFELVPTYSWKLREKAVLARATHFVQLGSQVENQRFGSARKKHILPLVAVTSKLPVVGELLFEELVVRPFFNENRSIYARSDKIYWKSVTTKLIGHRGFGANRKKLSGEAKKLEVSENTVLSFVTAASLGAEYVEFDVQLTRDNVPVIYHDFLVAETGIDVSVNSLDLKQFLALKPEKKSMQEEVPRRSKTPDLIIGNSPRIETTFLRSNFTSDTLWRKAKDEDMIKAPFTTLEGALKKVPLHIGFNIEIKYPVQGEQDFFKLPPPPEINHYLDQILECVFKHGNQRNIIFSSFHPDICMALSLKQPNFPVFFLTEGLPVVVHSDTRCNSLREAVRFATHAGLMGIVTECKPILQAPRLISAVKEAGLLIFTYGEENNNLESAELQCKYGVDAIIADSVAAIRRGLIQKEKLIYSNSL